jgi:tetratricopeptide (TPR) repeat protein
MGAYNNLAIVLALQGKFPEANEVIETGLKLDPENKDLKDRKASMVVNALAEKLKAGDYEGGLALLDQMLVTSPNDYDRLVQAAQTSFEYGESSRRRRTRAPRRPTPARRATTVAPRARRPMPAPRRT